MSRQAPTAVRRALLVVDLRTAIGVTVSVLCGFLLFAVAGSASGTITRIVIGIVLALALDGLVRSLMERVGMSRSVAVVCVAVGLSVVAGAVLLLLGPPAIDQAREIGTRLPETVEDLYDLPVIGGWLENADAATKVERWVDELPAAISTDRVSDAAESVLGGLVAVLTVVVTTLALLLDGERLVALVRRVLPEGRRDQADGIGRVVYQVVGRYFGGSLTVALMMGVYVLTIALVFGVPLAPLAAIWAMFTNLIPQIGGFLGGAFLAVLALAAGPGTAVVVIVLFVLYMNLENHIIQPAVIGTAVDLSPPTTMLAALVGGAAAGVPGALVATPLVGALKQLYLEQREPGSRSRTPPPSLLARLRRVLRRGD